MPANLTALMAVIFTVGALLIVGWFLTAMARASRYTFTDGGLRGRLALARLLPDLGAVELLTRSAAEQEGVAVPRRRRLSVEQRKRVLEAADLFDEACSGSYGAKQRLLEALTTSDFPMIFGAALDARLLDAYAAISPVWQGFAARDTVPDFREHSWVDLLGGQGALSAVGEGAPYPRRNLAEAEGGYSVAKYGDTIGLTWEMFINDRLNAFRGLPNRLAVAAREMEDRIATGQLATASGPNSALFGANKVIGEGGATSSNLLTGNPALSEQSLEDALTAISIRRDYDGRPIVLNAAVLVVPPQLQVTAERIVGATEIRDVFGTRTVVRTNPMAGRVRVIVDPWLLVVDQTANADSTWYLLPDPQANGRPAVVLGFLAGHETPDLRVKNDQGTRVGGGTISPEEGSFEFDTIDYRVRHVLGGGPVDANATAVSNGSGS